MTEFLGARSKAEAVARLYAVADVAPEPLGPGSTEKKTVLLSIADRFDVEVGRKSSKPLIAEAIAFSLGAAWPAAGWSRGSTITLLGLNTLLEAASSELGRRARCSALERAMESALALPGFEPARGKLEAVNRISALTHSGPQSLGPGSKERKSVLHNLAEGLEIAVDTRLSKVNLGAVIASSLGFTWHSRAWSAGQTITLEGLNILLQGAENRLGVIGRPLAETFGTPRDEAEALLAALADAIGEAWDGRRCVEEMRDGEFTHWKQTEWPGWYFEYVGIPSLVNTFGGGPRRVANTSFDYHLRSTWDLKAHSAGKAGVAPLNDIEAVRVCLEGGIGIGFLVLEGDADYSDESFDGWHRALRGAPPAHADSRLLKSSFGPRRIEAYHLASIDSLDAALLGGAMGVMKQGRQQSGASRRPKYSLKFRGARALGGLRIASRECEVSPRAKPGVGTVS